MRIHADVCGYIDWQALPEGVVPTPEDHSAGRVKKMGADKWHMRVVRAQDSTHAMGIPEMAIVDRMSALEILGQDPTREQVVAELVRASMRLHLKPEHLHEIEVDDEGPAPDLLRAMIQLRIATWTDSPLTEREIADGVTHHVAPAMSPEAIDAACARYASSKQGKDLASYLNVVMGSRPRAPKAGA